MTGNWWESRRDYESTADYLARVLADLGAEDLADKARLGHFDWAASPTGRAVFREFMEGARRPHRE